MPWCGWRSRRASTLLLYGIAVFSSEGVTSSQLPAAAIVVFSLLGPAMYVGATLPDLVDVRGLVVTVVVTAVSLVTVMAVFVLELSLVDALGDADPKSERSG